MAKTPFFGYVQDFFGFSNVASMMGKIIPVSSDTGDDKQRICVSHTGRYNSGVNQTSGVWRNPTVVYAVVADVTFTATLGAAWAATMSGTTMTHSGYMLTGVSIRTAANVFPTITCTACANEGANAINLFDVSVPILARAKAQALLSSVTGGGKLQHLTLTASCDPVVIDENLMPCASDVVNGKLVVEAETINIASEGAPSGANGFVSLGRPCRGGDSMYRTFSITAQKEIV